MPNVRRLDFVARAEDRAPVHLIAVESVAADRSGAKTPVALLSTLKPVVMPAHHASAVMEQLIIIGKTPDESATSGTLRPYLSALLLPLGGPGRCGRRSAEREDPSVHLNSLDRFPKLRVRDDSDRNSDRRHTAFAINGS